MYIIETKRKTWRLRKSVVYESKIVADGVKLSFHVAEEHGCLVKGS